MFLNAAMDSEECAGVASFFVSFVSFVSCVRRNCWSHQNAALGSPLVGVRTVRGLLIGSFNGRTCSTQYAFLGGDVDPEFSFGISGYLRYTRTPSGMHCGGHASHTIQSSKSTAMACLGMRFDSIPMKK